MLQAVNNNKLPDLEAALLNIKCLRTALQWIPSHCGIDGNEEADRMAKLGAEDEQEDNAVNMSEMKTIIKSLYRPQQPLDSYHQLSRPDQVAIFRLRTGHNRLLHHLHRKLHLVPSPRCPCGEADQTVEHILQDCGNLRTLREETWPQSETLQNKLYGPVETLQKTTSFISRAGLQV